MDLLALLLGGGIVAVFFLRLSVVIALDIGVRLMRVVWLGTAVMVSGVLLLAYGVQGWVWR
jgi:hypothetical protein